MRILCLRVRGRRKWAPHADGGGKHVTGGGASAAPKSGPSSLVSDHPGQDVTTSGNRRGQPQARSNRMTLSVVVTEDTPADMLTGQMGIRVLLPTGKKVKMNVNRSTPMMDLLVQVTTANKLSPAGHLLQPYGETGLLPYKPSTPIGTLDTWTVHVVPKLPSGPNSSSSKSGSRLSAQPFEQTFRLQVHLPRNQLYVMRVSGKTVLGDILSQACEEKCLDPAKYSLRHPKQLDQILDENLTIAEYRHNQICIVSNKAAPTPVSSEDIFAMHHRYAASYPSRDSSSRSLSPDSSVSPQPVGGPQAPGPRSHKKRRPAPKPPAPTPNNLTNENNHKNEGLGSTTVICHSRTSSDSSGYHEASVLSESPDSNNSLADSLPRRSKLPGENGETTNISTSNNNINNGSNLAQKQQLSRSMNSLNTKSLSTTSHVQGRSRKKQAPAPPPPVVRSISEDSSRIGATGVSSGSSKTSTSSTLPPGVKLRCPAPAAPPTVVAARPFSTHPVVNGSTARGVEEREPTMDDEEIDRIFKEATKDESPTPEEAEPDKTATNEPPLPSTPTDGQTVEKRPNDAEIQRILTSSANEEEPESIVVVAQEVAEVVDETVARDEVEQGMEPEQKLEQRPTERREQLPEQGHERKTEHRPYKAAEKRQIQRPEMRTEQAMVHREEREPEQSQVRRPEEQRHERRPDERQVQRPEQKPDQRSEQHQVQRPEQKPDQKPEQRQVQRSEQRQVQRPEQKPDERPEQRQVQLPEQRPDQRPEQRQEDQRPQRRPDQKPRIVDEVRIQRSPPDETDRNTKEETIEQLDQRRCIQVLRGCSQDDREEQKKAEVMSELTSVISEMKSYRRSESLKKDRPQEPVRLKTSSNLENFKMTTYGRRPQEDNKEKEEREEEPTTAEEVDDRKKWNCAPVKRSVSLFYKTAVSVAPTEKAAEADGIRQTRGDIRLQKLRKTTSELNITPEPEDKAKKRGDIENTITGLQSLQVLKSILPHLSQSQGAVDKLVTANNNANVKNASNAPKPATNGVCRDKPKVTMTTWGEREKREVSIKWDSDYHVVLNGNKPTAEQHPKQEEEQPKQQPKPQPKPQQQQQAQQPPWAEIRKAKKPEPSSPQEPEKPKTNGHKTTVVIVKDETKAVPGPLSPGSVAPMNRNGHSVYRALETGNTRPLGRHTPTVVAMQPRPQPLVSRIHFRGETMLGTDSGGVRIIAPKVLPIARTEVTPSGLGHRSPTSSGPQGPSQDLLAQIRTFGGRSNLKKPLAT